MLIWKGGAHELPRSNAFLSKHHMPDWQSVMISILRRFVYGTSAGLIFTTVSVAQPGTQATITGMVIDDSSNTAIEFANVFLAQTTLGCTTDQNGQFEIKNVPPGSYEIVASRVGFTLRSLRLSITQSETRQLRIKLRPSPIIHGEVVVSAPEPTRWRDQLQKFLKLFLGTTPNANRCKIINPEVLDFDEYNDVFVATARAPLEIDNKALGYHIRFELTSFRLEPKRFQIGPRFLRSDVLVCEGFPHYTTLTPGTEGEGERWIENRKRAFGGSLRHFLSALVTGNLNESEYEVNLMPQIRLQNTPIDRTRISSGNTDLILSTTASREYRHLRFRGFLEVEYTRGTLEQDYDLLRKRGTDSQVSWVELNYDSVSVNSRGLIREGFPTKVYGYWAWKRLADLLPLDYEPEG